jgi:hypothetical protein
MNPKLVAKLMSDVSEIKEFIAYVREECAKLNTISDFNENLVMTNEDLAVEVMSRRKAYQKLTQILNPLLNPQSPIGGVDPKEFIV